MSVDLLWFTGRGTGMIALVLLTVVVLLGVLGRSGRAALGLTRFALADVHRNTSLIALGLVFVHLIVLWMDPYARLTVFDLLIPFSAEYRPFWVGLGTLGMELMVLVVVTSLLRRRLGARAWKLVHWASYAMWPIAWLHGWFSGTDADASWFRLIAIVSLASVAAATAWRLSPRFLEFTRPRPAPPEPTAAVPEPTPAAAPPLVLREGPGAPGGRHQSGRGALRQATGAHPAVPRRSRPGVRALREPTGSQRPVSGAFRDPTGAQRTLTPFDQTGAQPRPPYGDHVGPPPRVPYGDPVGPAPRAAFGDHTGSQPRLPGAPPRAPFGDHTGSQPRVPFGDHTGSQPRIPFGDPAGPPPRAPFGDHTGSQPRVRDHTGSQPRIPTQPVPPAPGELPAFDHEDWFR